MKHSPTGTKTVLTVCGIIMVLCIITIIAACISGLNNSKKIRYMRFETDMQELAGIKPGDTLLIPMDGDTGIVKFPHKGDSLTNIYIIK